MKCSREQACHHHCHIDDGELSLHHTHNEGTYARRARARREEGERGTGNRWTTNMCNVQQQARRRTGCSQKYSTPSPFIRIPRCTVPSKPEYTLDPPIVHHTLGKMAPLAEAQRERKRTQNVEARKVRTVLQRTGQSTPRKVDILPQDTLHPYHIFAKTSAVAALLLHERFKVHYCKKVEHNERLIVHRLLVWHRYG